MSVRPAVPSFTRLTAAGLACVALASVHGHAQAQSSVTMYGVLDITFGSFQLSNSTGVKPVTKVDGNQMITSYIGFKGVEDLGGGMKAGFVLESFLRPDTGASGRNNATPNVVKDDLFFTRAANVYLQSDYGKLTIGRQINLVYAQALGYNPFGGAFGLSPTIRLTFGPGTGNDRGDSGWSNAITYATPNMGGATVAVSYQPGEAADKSERASYAIAANYVSGPFAVGGSWQTVRSAQDPKLDFTKGQRQTFGLLNTSYDFGVAKAFVQYGELSNSGFAGGARIDTKLYALGASVPVSAKGKVLASYGVSMEKPVEGGTTPKTKHTVLTLAYDHYLSKRTDIYTAVMVDEEKLPGFKTGRTYLVGLRHAF